MVEQYTALVCVFVLSVLAWELYVSMNMSGIGLGSIQRGLPGLTGDDRHEAASSIWNLVEVMFSARKASRSVSGQGRK